MEHSNNASMHVLCFLNQARAGHRPVRAWFLRIVLSVNFSVCVCVCVCVCACVHVSPPPEAINNLWCDIDPIRLVE